MEIQIGMNVLEKNDLEAQENARIFQENQVFVLNMMSSPGSGKTTVLENTITALKDEFSIAIIEGDVYTDRDAERIRQLAVPVVQINTHGGCHLDAKMIRDVLPEFDLKAIDFLVIENVGNLVCPAEFRLGENERVAVLSVPEGDDKPIKYPVLFRESGVALINKIDLLPFFDFNMPRVTQEIKGINPDIELFPISCTTKENFTLWLDWLRKNIRNNRG